MKGSVRGNISDSVMALGLQMFGSKESLANVVSRMSSPKELSVLDGQFKMFLSELNVDNSIRRLVGEILRSMVFSL